MSEIQSEREKSEAPEKNFPFEFSVVIAVYNVEPFLEGALKSLAEQSFGFEKIQVILVDDGSADKSGEICDQWAARFFNIVALHKKNGGVSSARNMGLLRATGRYVNFLDADDMLSKNAMALVHDFFTLHKEETDVVAIPIWFFDGANGPHMLNEKFKKGSRVADLIFDPDAIQLAINSTFIRREALEDLFFDEGLCFAEDAALLMQVFLKRPALGLCKGAKYFYRKRLLGSPSALQSGAQKKEYYIPHMERFALKSLELWQNERGFVPLFVQNTICYDLQWRIKQKDFPPKILERDEAAAYKSLIKKALFFIEDEIILRQKHCFAEHKCKMLQLKHGEPPQLFARKNDIALRYKSLIVRSMKSDYCKIEFFDAKNDRVFVEGHLGVLGVPQSEALEVFVLKNEEEFLCEQKNLPERDKYVLGEFAMKGVGFECEVPLDKQEGKCVFRIAVKVRGILVIKKMLQFGKFSPVCKTYKNAYFWSEGWIFQAKSGAIEGRVCGRKGRAKQEARFLKELWKSKKPSDKKAAAARAAHWILRPFFKRPVWIISDRVNKADDNGEALFCHILSSKQKLKNGQKKPRCYFAISKDCRDFSRMKKIGRVVPYFSYRHKMLFLLAGAIVSSHGEDFIYNVFQSGRDPYRDILHKKKRVFLQHGITKDDVSEWLNRYNKAFDGFVTAAIPERNSILNGSYFYPEKNVWLTGLPRHDRLYRAEEKIVTIMPTWRKALMSRCHEDKGEWDLKPDFEKSNFFKFYNALLNDGRLLSAARELGYKINFAPHPLWLSHLEKFSVPKELGLPGKKIVYRDIFAKTMLLVTDYSSVAFDFAYLRKPLIYFQADEKEFFAGQIYDKGYFDYEKDGFGEVERTIEGLCHRIIEYMQNDCLPKQKYLERAENFFAFGDANNSRRVYEALLALEG